MTGMATLTQSAENCNKMMFNYYWSIEYSLQFLILQYLGI